MALSLPRRKHQRASWTSYVWLSADGVFQRPNWTKTGRNDRRLSNTVAVVEMSPSEILWTAPYDLNVAEMSFKINDPDQAALAVAIPTA